MRSQSHAVSAQRIEPKDSRDDFPTPPWATRALIEHIVGPKNALNSMSCLEPACGAGHMAKVLKESGEVRCADAFHYGYAPVRDFLTYPYETNTVDWVITNPPFRLAEEFLARALKVARKGVAILARTVFLESIGRYETIYSVTPPPSLRSLSSASDDQGSLGHQSDDRDVRYAWFVWDKSAAGNPRLMWIPPCRRELEKPGDYGSFAS